MRYLKDFIASTNAVHLEGRLWEVYVKDFERGKVNVEAASEEEAKRQAWLYLKELEEAPPQYEKE